MRRSLQLLPVLVLIFFTGCHFHWRTVDRVSGPARPFAATSSGRTTFVGGSVETDGVRHWRIRKTSDRGASWSWSDRGDPSAIGGEVSGLASSNRGVIYAVGYEIDPTSRVHWLVRKSVDLGETWTTIDRVSELVHAGERYELSTARHVAVATDGTVYVTGSGRRTGSNWITRRSTDAGGTWVTVDVVASESIPRAIVARSDSEVFSAGYGTFGPNGEDRWVVRHLNPNGVWEIVDSYAGPSERGAYAKAAAISPRGKLVVAGVADGRWIVRSADVTAPRVWTVVDDFAPSGDRSAGSPHAVVFGPLDRVFVTGILLDSTRPSGGFPYTRYWTTRTAGSIAGPFRRLVSHVTDPAEGIDFQQSFGATMNVFDELFLAAPSRAASTGEPDWLVRRYGRRHSP